MHCALRGQSWPFLIHIIVCNFHKSWITQSISSKLEISVEGYSYIQGYNFDGYWKIQVSMINRSVCAA